MITPYDTIHEVARLIQFDKLDGLIIVDTDGNILDAYDIRAVRVDATTDDTDDGGDLLEITVERQA
jgi:hypothetical protein